MPEIRLDSKDPEPDRHQSDPLQELLNEKLDAWRATLPMKKTVDHSKDGPGVFIVTARGMAQLYDVVGKIAAEAYKGGANDAAENISAATKRRMAKRLKEMERGEALRRDPVHGRGGGDQEEGKGPRPKAPAGSGDADDGSAADPSEG